MNFRKIEINIQNVLEKLYYLDEWLSKMFSTQILFNISSKFNNDNLINDDMSLNKLKKFFK